MSDESNEAKIEIGPVCPPIGSWFFPNDPAEEPMQIDKEKKDGDSAQPS